MIRTVVGFARKQCLKFLGFEHLDELKKSLIDGRDMINFWVNDTVPEHHERQEVIKQELAKLRIEFSTLKGPYALLAKKISDLQDAQTNPDEI